MALADRERPTDCGAPRLRPLSSRLHVANGPSRRSTLATVSLWLSFAGAACSEREPLDPGSAEFPDSGVPEACAPDLPRVHWYFPNADPLTVAEPGSLEAQIQYDGCPKGHRFALCWDQTFGLSAGNVDKVHMYLAHAESGDQSCISGAIVTLAFDVSEIREDYRDRHGVMHGAILFELANNPFDSTDFENASVRWDF
ncbi:MAG: hypothetical protein K1X88_26675 [Nannocystaceae bacterium]|nr:hypothetical protein [Nannocystaceae bacterium]